MRIDFLILQKWQDSILEFLKLVLQLNESSCSGVGLTFADLRKNMNLNQFFRSNTTCKIHVCNLRDCLHSSVYTCISDSLFVINTAKRSLEIVVLDVDVRKDGRG